MPGSGDQRGGGTAGASSEIRERLSLEIALARGICNDGLPGRWKISTGVSAKTMSNAVTPSRSSEYGISGEGFQ